METDGSGEPLVLVQIEPGLTCDVPYAEVPGLVSHDCSGLDDYEHCGPRFLTELYFHDIPQLMY